MNKKNQKIKRWRYKYTSIGFKSKFNKKTSSQAKSKGYLTYSELNETMPPGEMSSEQIEDIMTALSEMGITLIESEEEQDESQGKQENETEENEETKELVVASSASDNLDRTDDPVRMYLREMGSVELLSREGEIAIAKRIEAEGILILVVYVKALLLFKLLLYGAKSS